MIAAFVRRLCLVLWVSPATLLGLLACGLTLLTGGAVARVDHTLECHGGFAGWLLERRIIRARAMTLGHVILGLDPQALVSTRNHERVHVRQCERWGPFFLPAYLTCSLYLWLRGRRPYYDNPFEVEAFRIDAQQNI